MEPMKTFLLAILCISVCTAIVDGYDSKFDDLDPRQLTENRRLLVLYVNCWVGKGKCTREAAFIKKFLPEALATNCSKCTPRQKISSEIVMTHLVRNEPELFKKLEAKFDPQGAYTKHFEALKNGQ